MSKESKYSYALLTAAFNERGHIDACIQSVLSQTVLPSKWVIVSDGSTDETDDIVKERARKSQVIHFIKKTVEPKLKGFSSKVAALKVGESSLNGINWDLIGILDADITLGNNYYEKALNKFEDDEKLGICGGYIFERDKGVFKSRPMNSPRSVAGGIQLFRRECYRDIGGLSPMPLGGEDWLAEIKARMKGWEVKAFSEIPAYHHCPSIGRRGLIAEGVRGGALDYSMGVHPLFEIFKCIRRINEKPKGIYAILHLYGYLSGYLAGDIRHVDRTVMSFLRREQLSRLKKKVLIYRRRDKE